MAVRVTMVNVTLQKGKPRPPWGRFEEPPGGWEPLWPKSEYCLLGRLGLEVSVLGPL